ncbi:MAG: shikimate dehydrogenase [Verrucomicrobiota bacterium]|nr:shikimate dehydrogenase [Verrucomicrobiota bacterium]
MLFASVPQLEEYRPIELRLDLFSEIPWAFLKERRKHLLLALRRTARRSEEEREAVIEQLLALEPPLFDLEGDMRPAFLHRVLAKYPATKFLLSYHNFDETPADLDPIYNNLAKYHAHGYKIATMAHSASDVLRLLLFGRKHSSLSVIPMGERGAFGRVLGPIVGNRIDYAYLDKPTAPGQLSVRELSEIYRYSTLNKKTALYGLIGDPVDKSLGHLYHNRLFAEEGRNAVYVKISLKEEELPSFFPLAKEMGFRGLSVTMPLKKKVLPWVDYLDPRAAAIGAVNTLVFTAGQILGSNTDGLGALDAIEKRGAVRGKQLVLLGAGGAARAIAFEAKMRGAEVSIFNRTQAKGRALAEAVGGFFGVPDHYDCLINCSPEPPSIEPLPGSLVLDIVYVPRETPLLQRAQKRGCQIIYGDEMFFNQANRQRQLWL